MSLSRLFDFGLTLAQERLVWLAGSVLLYVTTRNVIWALRRLLQRVSWADSASLLASLIRFAFYVGIPYLALLGGIVTLPTMGLVGPQHGSLIQRGLATVGAFILIGGIGWHYWRQVGSLDQEAGPLPQAIGQLFGQPWGWVLLLATVFYQQIHWAFYRALPFLILDDRYIGSFIGLALALLEAYADPRVRDDLTDPAQAEFLLLSAGLAVITTVLFVLAGTSWLGAGIHLLAAIGWLLFIVHGRQQLQPHRSQ